MTNEDKRMIPLSVVERWIEFLKHSIPNDNTENLVRLLTDLKKEAIPSPIEQKIKALIEKVKKQIPEGKIEKGDSMGIAMVNLVYHLENLLK